MINGSIGRYLLMFDLQQRRSFVEATVRSISIHTSPISGPLPFYIDDVVLEHVSLIQFPIR